ncbi:MAG TPA: MbnP family copper-binding protein, partial [Haliangium sp.]|nr:MbnP family copper-binding protein [Haliangium sp.]
MLPVLALVGACSDDGGGGDVDATPEFDAPPEIDAEPPGQAVTIDFAARVGTQEAACGDTAPYQLGTASTSVTLNDIRFYVSNIRLLSGAEEVPMNLEQDDIWQYRDVALLDFEDGSAGCVTSGNTETNTRVVGTVAPGTYDGIVFDLGVPYELNHQDLTTVPSPLNVASMYWAWALGHK